MAISSRKRFVFRWTIPGLFFVYFRSFSNKHYNFYSKLGNVKNVHLVTVLGFEPTTFSSRVSSITTRPFLFVHNLYCSLSGFQIMFWEGDPEGPATLFYPDGMTETRTYVKGVKEGPASRYLLLRILK